ncbi:MAG: hypothetical protein ACT4OJ_09370 [Bacteroidota bacterium]
MRKLLLPFLFLLAACGGKKEDKKPGQNENTDYLVSLDGIGLVKTSMSQEELEKAIQQKISLANPTDTISGSWMDSAFIKYKDAELRLTFVRTYAYEAKDSFHMRLTEISTTSPLCKTAGGIGIGSTKQQVVNAFDNYRIYMGPEYIMVNDTTWGRSKTLYSISVREDREGPQIVFYLNRKDNKVYLIGVGTFYDDSE